MGSRGTTAAADLIVDALSNAARGSRSLAVRGELLKGVPLFAGLSRRHRRKVAQLMDEVHYRHGRHIVDVGDPGNAFFIVIDGSAKVYPGKVATGRPRATLRPGDFFGEMAMLDHGPRSATVVASGGLSVLRLTRSAFLKMITREPPVAIAIMTGLASRLRRGDSSE